MRAYLTASLLCGAVFASGCSGETDVAALPDGGTVTGPAMENVAEPGAAEVNLTLGCGGPFTREATPATLAAVFGRENVIPETISGPEGAPLNVTAIYPNDPARRIEVIFRNEEERTDLSAVMVSSAESQWTGPGGVKIGDGIEAVQAANGAAFNVMGFQWDYGGYVADWQGGKLGESNGCASTVRLSPVAETLPSEIVGDGVQPSSDLPAVRAAQPKVSSFGINWAPAA
jgi:hypothetical protein